MSTAVVDGIDQNALHTTSTSPTSQPSADVVTRDASAEPAHTNGAPDLPAVPQVNVNGEPVRTPRPSGTYRSPGKSDKTTWGANFWVTLVDPQTNSTFFACPATGQVSWDPPVGTFVLPPSEEGEWWELSDESRGGIPYYYQTKTGETVWERPDGFVIPLTIIQQTALGRRLSQTGMRNKGATVNGTDAPDRTAYRKSRSQTGGMDTRRVSLRSNNSETPFPRVSVSSAHHSPGKISPSSSDTGISPRKKQSSPTSRPSVTNDQHGQLSSLRGWMSGNQLPPIPGSPYPTEPSTPNSRKSTSPSPSGRLSARQKSTTNGAVTDTEDGSLSRSRSKSSSYVPYRSPVPQSLTAALEMISLSEKRSTSDHGHPPALRPGAENMPRKSTSSATPPTDKREKRDIPSSPTKSSHGPFWMARSTSTPPPPTVNGKAISGPVVNQEATLSMSPVKNRGTGKPISIEPRSISQHAPTTTLASGKTYPVLPHDLASDIQQFVESEYAKRYFSIHRTGFIFRRKIPVAQMMAWQKAPLSSPLLTLNRTLKQDAVKIFKVIQHIMGDRERDRPAGIPLYNGSTTSLASCASLSLLEEERWLISEGLAHGELRDEIYCQLMKQLTGNPSAESVFKGWQMLCVLLTAFPPSKNFETYLRSFIHQHTSHSEGRVDVIAKYCLRRLTVISKRGPRGKPPSAAEIETAADAAFNPSTFGESLDATMRLQERNYPNEKIPIILPFLADGILALGGTKCEGIFRVPGDSDLVSELKLRIDRGYYTLENVDDPHVPASLLKLWLRELCDPLVPEELYNDCISAAPDPPACVTIVRKLPTINRRVVLFVMSFLQLFLEEKVLASTKMTAANMALVLAPNLLRCSSESMTVVFTNAQFEQMFVYNLLMHLKCNEVDEDYVPVHGRGASPPTSPKPRISKSRNRR
ncbi:hypothetical protein BKA82DRAFT_1000603 [Pisolithus tinctorius]|uniref:Rho-GAP domain-containing protein n=1 Tax=Pisolithus tinctorius Marx 270 TaxID=870435 RepID=A0A0C3J601_PISTI|nr:hypothetical protein BKA82DRAFT_1000603 [Pisolithus tinctorius]KIO04488.1 hypothetical protein M404DRAFT_1000603 [Pisolithus tinctorius Marx 270]